MINFVLNCFSSLFHFDFANLINIKMKMYKKNLVKHGNFKYTRISIFVYLLELLDFAIQESLVPSTLVVQAEGLACRMKTKLVGFSKCYYIK